MIWRAPLLIVVLVIYASISHSRAFAQDMSTLKAGVVRVENRKQNEVGTGIIVKIDKDLLYIVTSSHVVRGNQTPDIYLFNRPLQEPLSARLVYREDESQKGLALLTLKLKSPEMVSGLIALSLGDSSQLSGGEFVKIIGFPDGTSFWTVSNGTVSRVEGNSLVFAGPIRGGNSGGPVVLSNGLVVGMVTDTIESQASSYAAKAEIIVSYVNGLAPRLISITTSINTLPTPPTQQSDTSLAPNNELCKVIPKLVDAGRRDFYEIVGKATSSAGAFQSRILVPDALSTIVTPRERISSLMFSSSDVTKLESEYYNLVSKLRLCLPKWEEKEVRKGKLSDDAPARFYMFRENKQGVVLVLQYRLTPDGCCYYLYFSINTSKHFSGRW